MSTHNLQPSPFAPNQFLVNLDHDGDMSGSFIKKRPLELTEDLVEGRVDYRLRRCTSPMRSQRGFTSPMRCFSEPPELSELASREPYTPPNRPQSPALPASPSRASLARHSPQSRRKANGRRQPKLRRACTGISISRKSATRESSPAFAISPPRSPLARWTPQAMSIDTLPATPPPRPASAYPFGVLPPNSWSARLPWTVTSPSSSPYPDSEHPA